MALKWAVDMVSSIGSVTKEMGKLGKATKGTGLFGGGAALGRLGVIGAALTAKEYVADPLEERFTWLKDNVVTRSLNELPWLDSVDALGKKLLPWRRNEASEGGINLQRLCSNPSARHSNNRKGASSPSNLRICRQA
ncbi:hypothetical protein NYP82_19820 [Erwinia pyrifoliae]|nr:hypothetical protein [Erwinia pyrifoliae]MCT2385103.1 hypothetical protein [Erwinia pyrifoliae]MCT2388795.1 hypothetical protein [Erwinia pyrifoliae]